MWFQVAEQSGSRVDLAASSGEHATAAVGPGVGQVGQLAALPGATGESSRSFYFDFSSKLFAFRF